MTYLSQCPSVGLLKDLGLSGVPRGRLGFPGPTQGDNSDVPDPGLFIDTEFAVWPEALALAPHPPGVAPVWHLKAVFWHVPGAPLSVGFLASAETSTWSLGLRLRSSAEVPGEDARGQNTCFPGYCLICKLDRAFSSYLGV